MNKKKLIMIQNRIKKLLNLINSLKMISKYSNNKIIKAKI